MPRFARMLKSAFEEEGNDVQMWSPRPRVFDWIPAGRFAKWGGYVDQYLLFPIWVRKALKRTSADTLFVFCDQAMGPWVPLVKDRPHVVHVHDLLALRSALGEVRENPTAASGRIYQRYIRRGFRQARHFISVSKKTREDLQRLGGINAATSAVVYNGMHFPFSRVPFEEARGLLGGVGLRVPEEGMLLHVGGGQWYKNLPGVLAIYARYARETPDPLALWCVGPEPNAAARAALSKVPSSARVQFVNNVDDAGLQALYSCARVFLFPSLAEGFGWPLIEAQACGCPVITTDAPPMNEVAGAAAFYLPRLTYGSDVDEWAANGAAVLGAALGEKAAARARRMRAGQRWARRFDRDRAIESYLSIYRRVLELGPGARDAAARFGQENPL